VREHDTKAAIIVSYIILEIVAAPMKRLGNKGAWMYLVTQSHRGGAAEASGSRRWRPTAVPGNSTNRRILAADSLQVQRAFTIDSRPGCASRGSRCAKDNSCSMRFGVNAGSLGRDLLERSDEPCPEVMIESALNHWGQRGFACAERNQHVTMRGPAVPVGGLSRRSAAA
jgi:hypothetical protein